MHSRGQYLPGGRHDGALNDTNTTAGSINELNSKNMTGRIGALLTASVDAGNVYGAAGAGKLSASLDEFRFWKARRNGEDIGLNWKSQVRGGVNTDINNATLGVYYKFNEGVTGENTIDDNVLDYSGRISNGTWTGYDAYSRSTSSALVESGNRTSEYLDPIIYSTHPSVSSLRTELLAKGENFDLNNMIVDYNKMISERYRYLNESGSNNILVKSLEPQLDNLIQNISISLSNFISSIDLKLDNLKVKENEFDSEYNRVPENEKTLRSIERELSIKEALYLLLLQKREEASINLAVVKPTIKVIDYAITDFSSKNPSSSNIYLSLMALSVFIYFISLYTWFFLDNKIHTKDQLIGLLNNNIPIIGKLSDPAIAEGGDMFWLDKETLVIGKGFRTNQIAIEQITSMLSKINVEVVSFDLPFFLGREACLHMMSLISIVDEKKALVYFSLLPVGLVQLLEKKGYDLIEAPEDEFISSKGLNINVLAIKPGICVMISGCPKTKRALEKKGVTVYTFEGDALCIGCEGGPTCLTRPILRA